MAMTKLGRKCSRCKTVKPDSDFNKKLDGLQSRCRDCCRHIQWEIRYGITKEQYEELLLKQGGFCAICRGPEPMWYGLSVDHDRACCPGKKSCGECVRGLLCSLCNPMIGYSRDTPQVLRDAALYLERHNN